MNPTRTRARTIPRPWRAQRLAVDGGIPVRSCPVPTWPVFDEEMIAAVEQVLRSGRVNQWTGTQVTSFEAEFASSLHEAGSRGAHAVAVANGTLALELALHALGVGPGDDVVVPARTFVATATAVAARGARPVFADVDPVTQGLTAGTVLEALTPCTRAVVAVHLGGWPVDVPALRAVTDPLGIAVVEDCAQAHGGSLRGTPIGLLGDAAAFSFCQDKNITTGGEGGMLVVGSEPVRRRAWSYKDHGKDWTATHTPASEPGFRWVHDSLGTNWRLTEMQAAIGRIAVRRLRGWVTRRNEHCDRLAEAVVPFAGVSLPRPCEPGTVHGAYRAYVVLQDGALRPDWSIARLLAAVAAEGVPVHGGSCSEVYLERAFPPAWRPGVRLPGARWLAEHSFALLVHPTLTRGDVDDTAEAVVKVLTQALA